MKKAVAGFASEFFVLAITNGMSKPNLVLDLDQTLISSESIDEFDAVQYWNKSKKFQSTTMEGYYFIFERPHLQKFLDFVFANFNVTIWTAADKDYALYIIDKIIVAGKPNRKLDYIFYGYHCEVSDKAKGGTKALAMLWDTYSLTAYSKTNTAIMDDYDEVYNTQPDNCIVVPVFEFKSEGSENDDFLKKLIPKLKKHCVKHAEKYQISKLNKALK